MRATSASPSTPLAPPTTTSSASSRRTWAIAATATSGALSGWIRPTNSTTGRSAGRPTARRAPLPVAGREEGVLDGRRHDLDRAGGVAVQAAELALLLRAADADGVAAADDLRLGPVPPRRLEVAALGLDPGQGVERRDERQVEVVLEPVADHAAQPVVAVDRRRRRARRAGARGRRAVNSSSSSASASFGRSNGPAGTCTTRWPGSTTTSGARPGPVGAGVRRALDAGLGERRRDLAHVDVHPAAVAGTRLEQRRRVERDHRDALHGVETLLIRSGTASGPTALPSYRPT